MAGLADLERLFERLFERSSARLFRTRLQELQVERRVERAMERARVGQGNRTVVPARYRVRLEGSDLKELAGADGPEALAGRLADGALAFARAHGYYLAGRPTVSLVVDPAVERGTVEVDAVATPGRVSAPRAEGRSPATAKPGAKPVPDVPVLGPRSDSAASAPVAGSVPDGVAPRPDAEDVAIAPDAPVLAPAAG